MRRIRTYRTRSNAPLGLATRTSKDMQGVSVDLPNQPGDPGIDQVWLAEDGKMGMELQRLERAMQRARTEQISEYDYEKSYCGL